MNLPSLIDRRQFLIAGPRYVLLAGLAALAVAGETKRRRLANDPHCVHLWTCADCAEFGGCTKPKRQQFAKVAEPSRL